jgi:23S rRNA (guanine745-N1)-methyltransferase
MSIVRCPNCKRELQKNGNTYVCHLGHSFDISKEGYSNLILANQKKKLSSGDNKMMIRSREAFLSQGYYDFIIDAIESLTLPNLIFEKDKINVLDLGCGSGYYIRNIYRKIESIQRFGIDVSKNAITHSAKKDRQGEYFVSSNFNSPFLNNTLDIVLNIFAPCQLNEVSRLLRPDGLYVKVIPINEHMKEVADMVYKKFSSHSSTIESDIEANNNLNIIATQDINQSIVLNSENLKRLISMTPYYYKFTDDQLSQLGEMSITTSFRIIVAQKVDVSKAH